MKSIIIGLCTLALLCTTSCKNDAKTTPSLEIETTVKTKGYTIKPEATNVKWTAYKTTGKKPVSGNFTVLKFNEKSGKTPTEVLNGLQFSIPVSSVFSKNEVRDTKLKESFFAAMLNPDFLKGSISFTDGSNCKASITMNGETHDLALQYTIEGNNVSMHGVMNLEEWNALGAVEALNKVCFDLHKGEDGVSKTWNDVAIEITTRLIKQ